LHGQEHTADLGQGPDACHQTDYAEPAWRDEQQARATCSTVLGSDSSAGEPSKPSRPQVSEMTAIRGCGVLLEGGDRWTPAPAHPVDGAPKSTGQE